MATELGCGMKCLKYLLFVINFIVWICGIAVFGVGIYSRVKSGEWEDLIKNASVADAANLLIASGAIVMVIGFIGCCGAWKQNRPFLIIYIILLLLIFILEIAGGIYAYTKKDKIIDDFKDGFQETINNSYGQDTGTNKANKGLTDSVDWFQKNVECCGSAGPSSWNNTKWYNSRKTANGTFTLVPDSCCKASGCNVGSDGEFSKLANIWNKGCVDQGEKFIKDHIAEIGGVGVGIAFVQLIGIIFAILLVRSINENKL